MRYLLVSLFCATLFVSTVWAAPYWQYRFLEATEEIETTEKTSNWELYRQILKVKDKKTLEPKEIIPEKHTLIIAPHPDDEILCCTSVIRKAVEEDLPLKIVYLTDGDAKTDLDPQASREYGLQRRAESTNATRLLGVDPVDLIWLGFPDSILGNLRDRQIISPFTLRKATASNTYKPQLPYTRENLDMVLLELIDKYAVDTIYFPNENTERHADHIAAGEIVWSLIKADSEALHHYRYSIHNKNFKRDAGFTDTQKIEAIKAFKSQFHDASHAEFLLRFAYKAELFE